ncbi:MAG: EAL domain-containing protein [Gammaproteobacteria bacterium]|nr:EAL domain-containing protein [Gammaproteobacteria bacterium]
MNKPVYRQASTKSIITTGFVAIFALMAALVWLSLATLQAVNTRMSDLIDDTEVKTGTAYQMRDVIRRRTSETRSLAQVTGPEERERIFNRLIDLTATYHEGRLKLLQLGSTTAEREILEKIETDNERVAQTYNQVNDALFSMADDEARLKSAIQQTQLQELVLLNRLNDLVELERAIADEQLASNQTHYHRTQQALLFISMVVLILGVVIAIVVTNRVSRANSRIAHLASHDDMTGLANRREFELQLSHTITVAAQSPKRFGLMYLDMDRFKIVNDTCGHHAGDKLLIELTELISSRLRSADLFARIGGDEFAIIAAGRTFESITTLADDIRSMVSDYVFTYENQQFKVSLSIGLIPIRGDITDLETLLTNVDSACYIAKQSGRNRVHVARSNDADITKYKSDIASIQFIRQAVAEDRLRLYYQPVFKITGTGVQLEHCEILLRIISETGEVLSPAEFIPLAEKYNLMHEIDRWVLTHVLEWIRANQQQYRLPRLLINLSGLSFIDNEFLDFSMQQLQQDGIDASRIAFEITETAAVDNLDLARGFMQRIRSLGCRFALDDFGSGFSTFAYLKNLPIDYLKIDGSLVRNLATDDMDLEMVRAINQIGHTVGARTIAEFVENDDILDILRELGVDYAQGYGLQKPQELSVLLESLPQVAEDNDLTEAFRKTG